MSTHRPFDAVLVVSFGGPQGPDDIRPFLANVLRGRRIPPDGMVAIIILKVSRSSLQAVESKEALFTGRPTNWG